MQRQLIAATAVTCLAAGLPGIAQAATSDPTTRPADTVTLTSTEGTPDCATGTVLATTVTTTASWTWDARTDTWVPAAPVVITEEAPRALTATERDTCGDQGDIGTAPTLEDGELGTPPVLPEADDVAVAPTGTRDPAVPAPGPRRTYLASAETYRWTGSTWFGNRIAAFDDDGVLRYRENGFLWMSRAARAKTSHSHRLVAFSAPANATSAQLVAAYNAVAPVGARIATTTRLGRVTRSTGSVTDVWLLGRGATAAAVWGAARTTNPIFLGRR